MTGSSLWADLRFAFRTYAGEVTFTVAALLSLALGIGLNTGVFTFLNAVFLRPFPVQDQQRLVSMVSTDPNDPRLFPNSYANYLDYRHQNDVFSGLMAFQAIDVSLAGSERPERVIGQIVTSN